MVNLKINDIELEVQDGLTILKVAANAGIKIPTLCNSDHLPHYSSCMVCMVKDKKTGNFVPSCSSVVREGMDIDCSSQEVISLRQKSVELLLSEHRAECEAPCKVVCPHGYNIPLMNRLLQTKNIGAAIELSVNQLQTLGLQCFDCAGYCENACRRKKIDLPVSIRNLQIFVSQQIKKKAYTEISNVSPEKSEKPAKRFTSRIGKLEPGELSQWVKECKDDLMRFREIADLSSASNESESCMHCDCRASENCKLRNIAQELSVKDPKGKDINSLIEKKINTLTGLIFENAKCIKCGLCVRLCDALKEEPGLCFINRGFVSIISEPLTVNFNDIIRTKSKEVVEICPTGALSIKA